MLYVNDASETWKYTTTSSEIVEYLQSNQEEADTRMLLLAKNASLTLQDVVLSSPDTDVFIIALSKLHDIEANMYMLTGTGDKKRLIDLNSVADNAFTRLDQVDCSKDMYFEALLGFHCFTGCDSTSSFSGRGKNKPLQILNKSEEYINTFASLGCALEVTENTVEILQSFVCHMYGKKDALALGISLNDLRYHIYCQKAGKVSCETLPPCTNVLEQHIKRVNFQTRIWRTSLQATVEPESPTENGWSIDNDGLSITWMTCNPAPEEVSTVFNCDIDLTRLDIELINTLLEHCKEQKAVLLLCIFF